MLPSPGFLCRLPAPAPLLSQPPLLATRSPRRHPRERQAGAAALCLTLPPQCLRAAPVRLVRARLFTSLTSALFPQTFPSQNTVALCFACSGWNPGSHPGPFSF